MKYFRKAFWFILFFITGTYSLYKRIVYGNNSKKITNSNNLEYFKEVCYSVKYYRDNINNSSAIPITDKKSFKEAGNNMLFDNYRINRDLLIFKFGNNIFMNLKRVLFDKDFLFGMSTGGTTGSPLNCLKNKNILISDLFLFIRGWRMMGYKPGDRLVIFYHSYYNYELKWINNLSFITGIKFFFFDYLSESVAIDLAKMVDSFMPDYLITFPSYINDVATMINQKKIKMNHVLKGIEVSGESFFPDLRINCEKAFKTKVYDGYGSIEFGMIAHECSFTNGMHIYEDVVFAETIKEDKKDAIVITRPDMKDMPMLRYKIGDLGKIISDNCKCGINGLKLVNVDGRIDDYVLLDNSKRVYPSTFRQGLSMLNHNYNNCIVESNIVQNNKKKIIVNIVINDKSLKSIIKQKYGEYLKKILPTSMGFIINFPNNLEKRKKFRFIERNIK